MSESEGAAGEHDDAKTLKDIATSPLMDFRTRQRANGTWDIYFFINQVS